jgi:hypothetical protein
MGERVYCGVGSVPENVSGLAKKTQRLRNLRETLLSRGLGDMNSPRKWRQLIRSSLEMYGKLKSEILLEDTWEIITRPICLNTSKFITVWLSLMRPKVDLDLIPTYAYIIMYVRCVGDL